MFTDKLLGDAGRLRMSEDAV